MGTGLPAGIQTLPQLWEHTFQQASITDAFLSGGNESYTYKQIHAQAHCLAAFLQSRGVQKGDPVLILGSRRVDYLSLDLAILLSGGINITLDSPDQSERLSELLTRIRPQMIFLAQYGDYTRHRAILDSQARQCEIVCRVSEEDIQLHDQISDLSFAVETGKVYWRENQELIRARRDSVTSSDLATVIFSTATERDNPTEHTAEHTISYTHGQLMRITRDCVDLLKGRGPGSVLYNAMTHEQVLSRTAGYYMPLARQFHIRVGHSLQTVVSDIRTRQPAFLVGHPELFESLFNQTKEAFRKKYPVRAASTPWAIRIAVQYHNARAQSPPRVPFWLWTQYRLASLLVMNRFRKTYWHKIESLVTQAGLEQQVVQELYRTLQIPIHSLNVNPNADSPSRADSLENIGHAGTAFSQD